MIVNHSEKSNFGKTIFEDEAENLVEPVYEDVDVNVNNRGSFLTLQNQQYSSCQGESIASIMHPLL